jgi:pantoate--beta-alanine ligase
MLRCDPNAMQRRALEWRRAGIPIGLVPTMGALHEGHLSLMRAARARIGPHGRLVVSIYVNPTQFAAGEDFERYPRDLARDRALCGQAGVDLIFTPTDAEMYPLDGDGPFSTYVVEQILSERLEGVSRPGHFRGVATVVAKLFNIVQPDVAVFGAKDFQQVAVIRRMIRDLNFPVKLVVAPTVREPDGLALSSRNGYLSAEERAQAVVLWQAIQFARQQVRSAPVSAAKLTAQVARLIARAPAARVDSVEFFHPATLEPVKKVSRGTHLALAVFIGRTRLIDNARM